MKGPRREKRERERGTERDRQKERERGKQTDRRTDLQAQTHREKIVTCMLITHPPRHNNSQTAMANIQSDAFSYLRRQCLKQRGAGLKYWTRAGVYEVLP